LQPAHRRPRFNHRNPQLQGEGLLARHCDPRQLLSREPRIAHLQSSGLLLPRCMENLCGSASIQAVVARHINETWWDDEACCHDLAAGSGIVRPSQQSTRKNR
jgi:hypothetical protein